MHKVRVYLCAFSLGIGAALVGLVIGFLIKQPRPAVSIILLVVGIALLALAIVLTRRTARDENTPYVASNTAKRED